MSREAVVIGGGLGGLAAATLLARAGRHVTLLERASHVGGRATSQELGGALFNQGPHALYRGGPAQRVLNQIGIRYTGSIPETDANWMVRNHTVHPLPAGPLSMLFSSALTRAEGVALMRALARLVLARTGPLQSVTLDEHLNRTIQRPRVRELILALTRVTSYTNAPQLVSAGTLIGQLRLALKNNVLYLDGGWQSLVEALRATAEAAGVTIRTSASATAVQPGRVTLANGEHLNIAHIVIAVSPQAVASLIGTALWPQPVPVHAACLDVALRALPLPERQFALGLDAPHYFSVHTRYAKLGPKDVYVLQAAKYLAPSDSGNSARAELEALTDLMQPGWREQVIDQRFLPHLTVMHAAPLASRGGLAGRPPVKVPGMDGVYVVGDWVCPEGMLSDASFASAAAAAEAIVRSSDDAHPSRRLMAA